MGDDTDKGTTSFFPLVLFSSPNFQHNVHTYIIIHAWYLWTGGILSVVTTVQKARTHFCSTHLLNWYLVRCCSLLLLLLRAAKLSNQRTHLPPTIVLPTGGFKPRTTQTQNRWRKKKQQQHHREEQLYLWTSSWQRKCDSESSGVEVVELLSLCAAQSRTSTFL